MAHHTTRFRPAIKGLALIMATLTIAGSGAGVAAAAPSRHSAGRVGPGWSVAEYSGNSDTTLYLVSPHGRKFAFYTSPGTGDGPGTYYLTDWSRDGRRVLLGNLSNKFEQISVLTGKVISKFSLPDDVIAVGYTGPADQSILAMHNYSADKNSARIYDLKGKLIKILTTSGPPLGAIGAPGGHTAIVSADNGLEQVTNTGRIIRRLHPPVRVSGCAPRRWWTATIVLASCNAKEGSFIARLWLFPVSGGRATPLTAQRRNGGSDDGDIGAWKLADGLYLQTLELAQCGGDIIATPSRHGSVHRVTVPGTPGDSSDRVIAGQGSRLLVQIDPCSGRPGSLAWFNPHTRKVTWAIRAPKDVVGVESTVPFGGPLSENAL
jgi:hypothetical protein